MWAIVVVFVGFHFCQQIWLNATVTFPALCSLLPNCWQCKSGSICIYIIQFIFPHLQLSHRVGDLLIRIQVLLVYRYSLQLDGIISVLDGIENAQSHWCAVATVDGLLYGDAWSPRVFNECFNDDLLLHLHFMCVMCSMPFPLLVTYLNLGLWNAQCDHWA